MSTVPVFNFPVQANDTGKKEYIVRKAQFGDGYEQTSGEGINDSRMEWGITFTGKKEDADKVIQFLDERKGYMSFAWKDPLGLISLYKSNSWNITPLARDVFQVTTTFKQSFGP